ncbi:hypothetical protein CU098_004996, partial [Rhizopus stolonifer]
MSTCTSSSGRLGHSIICPQYDSKDSNNTWLQQYELQCKRLSLKDDQKPLQISQYLLADLPGWVVRSQKAATWSSLKKSLLSTFSIPADTAAQGARYMYRIYLADRPFFERTWHRPSVFTAGNW